MTSHNVSCVCICMYVCIYIYIYIYIYTTTQASLSGTDRTPLYDLINHVPNIQLDDLSNNGQFNHVWVHLWYTHLLFPDLARIWYR